MGLLLNARLCVCDEEGLHVQAVDSFLEESVPFLANVIPLIVVILIAIKVYSFF